MLLTNTAGDEIEFTRNAGLDNLDTLTSTQYLMII